MSILSPIPKMLNVKQFTRPVTVDVPKFNNKNNERVVSFLEILEQKK